MQILQKQLLPAPAGFERAPSFLYDSTALGRPATEKPRPSARAFKEWGMTAQTAAMPAKANTLESVMAANAGAVDRM